MNKILDHLKSGGRIGFKYHFRHYWNDRLIDESVETNLIPDGGLEYLISAALRGGSAFSSWYIGMYEGNYAPQADDDMSNIVSRSTELTSSYDESTRVIIVPDTLAAGLYLNSASSAVFTFNTTKTVRGAFIASNSGKGGATGVLLSAVLASSPKAMNPGEQLKVITGLNLISA